MSQFKMSARREPEKPVQPETWNFALEPEQGKIVAFSGKLGAGKDSACRFLYSLAFMHVLGLTEEAFVNEQGKLVVRNQDGLYEFDDDSKDPANLELLNTHVWPFIRKFSTAGPFKSFLAKMFDVPSESLYGTQEEKLVPINHILWENMPGDPKLKLSDGALLKSKSGPMCGRELMEFFGSEVIRKIYPRAHAKALAKDIVEYNSKYSMVQDIRFIDEIEEVQAIGGKVIRLDRLTEEGRANTHRSNTELDGYTGFDAVIPDGLSMQETFALVLSHLTSWGWFSVVEQ